MIFCLQSLSSSVDVNKVVRNENTDVFAIKYARNL